MTADEWRARLREALVVAMRERRSSAVKALRSTLAAIDNAEAVPDADAPTANSDVIPGAIVGLGAAEVARRELSDEGVRAIIRAEIADRHAAAQEYDDAGRLDRALELREEAAAIERLTTTRSDLPG